VWRLSTEEVTPARPPAVACVAHRAGFADPPGELATESLRTDCGCGLFSRVIGVAASPPHPAVGLVDRPAGSAEPEARDNRRGRC